MRILLDRLKVKLWIGLFLTDEEQFSNLQLWKNLLLRTCREKLWDAESAFNYYDFPLADHNLHWRPVVWEDGGQPLLLAN